MNRALRYAFSGLAVVALAHVLGHALGCVPEPPKDPSSALSFCAGEARSAFYVEQKTADEAMNVYEKCLQDAGIYSDGGAR